MGFFIVWKSRINGYYFITDSILSRAGNASDVKNALAAKVGIIQYREKTADTKRMCQEARSLKNICKDAIFLINDRVDVALNAGADGIHLGREDISYQTARLVLGKNKIIGLTVHNLKEAKAAQKMGADYIGVAPIFRTTTKLDANVPVGVGMIKKIKKEVSIPVVAIGGITLLNARDVVAAGADAICAISEVVTKPYVKGEIEKFQALFE